MPQGQDVIPPEYAAVFARLNKVGPTTIHGRPAWKALCPLHDDSKPSMCLWKGDNDSLRVTCFACDATRKQLAAKLGLEESAFFPPKETCRSKGFVATYDYCDEDGKVLYQVVRKKDKEFPVRRPSDNGWDWGLGQQKRVLYRLPELMKAGRRRVFFVEGEKDADALCQLGLVATTNPGGAGKWEPQYSEQLAGRHVVLIPDNDEPGHAHVERVAGAISSTVGSVCLLYLAGLKPQGDVSDWLAGGGTVEELKRLVRRASRWKLI